MSKPNPELLDRIHRDRLNRSQAESPFNRLFAGPMLHDLLVERMQRGVRVQLPKASEHEVLRIVQERIDRRRERGNQPWEA